MTNATLTDKATTPTPDSASTFDPALSATLDRTEDAAAHITAAQVCLWTLARKDAAFGDIALRLAGVLGSIEARRHALEEDIGL